MYAFCSDGLTKCAGYMNLTFQSKMEIRFTQCRALNYNNELPKSIVEHACKCWLCKKNSNNNNYNNNEISNNETKKIRRWFLLWSLLSHRVTHSSATNPYQCQKIVTSKRPWVFRSIHFWTNRTDKSVHSLSL